MAMQGQADGVRAQGEAHSAVHLIDASLNRLNFDPDECRLDGIRGR